MPTYPGGVISFTSKNNGDVIAASHVNDLQGEVTAIEDGVLNGTARLNSSNSTLAALSVTNGSTLNTLSVGGGSTFASRPTMPPPDAALLFLASTRTMGSSGASTLAWNAEEWLTNSSAHSTTSNPERLIPQSTGIYKFVAQITMTATSTGDQRAVSIRDSSGNSICNQTQQSDSNVMSVQAVGYKRFDALGGYAVVVLGTGQTASTLSLSTGVGTSFFAMNKL